MLDTPHSFDDGRSVVHFRPVAERQAAAAADLASHESVLKIWDAASVGMMLASLAYPPLGYVWLFYLSPFLQGNLPSLPSLSGFLISIPFFMVASLAASLMMAPLASWLMLIGLKVSDEFDMCLDRLWLIGFVAGLGVFAACSVFVVYAALFGEYLAGFGLLMLGTILTQAGAVLSCHRMPERIVVRELCKDRSPYPRFRIKHFAWLTLTLALFLAVLKCLGASVELFSVILAVAVCWFACQAFSLWGILRLIGSRANLEATGVAPIGRSDLSR